MSWGHKVVLLRKGLPLPPAFLGTFFSHTWYISSLLCSPAEVRVAPSSEPGLFSSGGFSSTFMSSYWSKRRDRKNIPPSPSLLVCFCQDGLSHMDEIELPPRLSLSSFSQYKMWFQQPSLPTVQNVVPAAIQASLLCVIPTLSKAYYYFIEIFYSSFQLRSAIPLFEDIPNPSAHPIHPLANHRTAISEHSNDVSCLSLHFPYSLSRNSIAIKPRAVAMPSQWRCLLEKKKGLIE